MARVFLDANAFIDLLEERGRMAKEALNGHDLFVSTLSLHILMYVTKQKIPYTKLLSIIDLFLLVPLGNAIANEALVGPTTDFEDNVQLHSAAEAECDLFLTSDEDLLSLAFFGKTRIVSSLR